MPFESGNSMMAPQTIRPIPKPSIGAKESFIEGVGEGDSLMAQDNKAMTPIVSRKPPRYAQSDADLITIESKQKD